MPLKKIKKGEFKTYKEVARLAGVSAGFAFWICGLDLVK